MGKAAQITIGILLAIAAAAAAYHYVVRDRYGAPEFRHTMKAYETLAVNFAQALADARWDDAHSLLDPELQQHLPSEKLADNFRAMYSGYADGPVTSVHFDPQFSMETWPAKEPGDVGWAYVSLQGDDFVEAVTVVVSSRSGRLAIRDIEWGRP